MRKGNRIWKILIFISMLLFASCSGKQSNKVPQRKIDVSVLRDPGNWEQISVSNLEAMMQKNIDENNHFDKVALYFGSSSENKLFFYTVDEANQRGIDHLYSWDAESNAINEVGVKDISDLFHVIMFDGQPVYLMVNYEQDRQYKWSILMNDEVVMQGKVGLLSQLPMITSSHNTLIVHTTTPTDDGISYQLYKMNGQKFIEMYHWDDKEYGSLHIKDNIASNEQLAFVMSKKKDKEYDVTGLLISGDKVSVSKLETNKLPFNVILMSSELLYLIPEIVEEEPFLRTYDQCRLYMPTKQEGSQKTNWVGDCVTNMIHVDEYNAIGIKNNVLTIYYKVQNREWVVEQVDLMAWLPEFTIPLEIAVVDDQLLVFPSGERSDYFFMEKINLFD